MCVCVCVCVTDREREKEGQFVSSWRVTVIETKRSCLKLYENVFTNCHQIGSSIKAILNHQQHLVSIFECFLHHRRYIHTHTVVLISLRNTSFFREWFMVITISVSVWHSDRMSWTFERQMYFASFD